MNLGSIGNNNLINKNNTKASSSTRSHGNQNIDKSSDQHLTRPDNLDFSDNNYTDEIENIRGFLHKLKKKSLNAVLKSNLRNNSSFDSTNIQNNLSLKVNSSLVTLESWSVSRNSAADNHTQNITQLSARFNQTIRDQLITDPAIQQVISRKILKDISLI